MKRFLSAALVGAICLATASVALAQSMKPVAVISLSGYDELMADVDYLGELADQPDASKALDFILKSVTQGQGLKGLDKKKPWGLVVLTDGTDQFRPLGFIPVSDLKGLLGSFAQFIGAPQEKENGVMEIQPPQGGPSVFLKDVGGYACIAQSAEHLAEVPANPVALLEGLNTEYDIAARVYVQNVPETYRDMFVSQFREGMQRGLQQTPGEDDAAFQVRKNLVEAQMQQLDQLFKELDKFTVGLKIDPSAKNASLDFGMSVMPGSKTAGQLAKMADLKTDYAGFHQEGAALNLGVTQTFAPEDAQQFVAMVKTLQTRADAEIDKDPNFPDDASRDVAKGVVGDFVNVFVKTVESGKMDGGATVSLGEKQVSLVAGGYVADGPALEAAIKKLIDMVKNEAEFNQVVKVSLDSGKAGDLNLHSLSITVPDPKAQEIFGDKLEVRIGIGPKSAFVALGKDPEAALKGVLDKSKAEAAKATLPMQLVVAIAPILKFVDSVEPNPIAGMMAEELNKSTGKDHLSLTVRAMPDKNAVGYRLLLEEGVLRLIASGAKFAGAGQGGGF